MTYFSALLQLSIINFICFSDWFIVIDVDFYWVVTTSSKKYWLATYSTCKLYHGWEINLRTLPPAQDQFHLCWYQTKWSSTLRWLLKVWKVGQIWSDDEETDEDRNDTSMVIRTTSDQIENGEKEIEKPEQEEGSESKGSSAIVDEAEGLNKDVGHVPEKDGTVSGSLTQRGKCVKCDKRELKGSRCKMC